MRMPDTATATMDSSCHAQSLSPAQRSVLNECCITAGAASFSRAGERFRSRSRGFGWGERSSGPQSFAEAPNVAEPERALQGQCTRRRRTDDPPAPSYDEDRRGSSAIRLLMHFDKSARFPRPDFPLPQRMQRPQLFFAIVLQVRTMGQSRLEIPACDAHSALYRKFAPFLGKPLSWRASRSTARESCRSGFAWAAGLLRACDASPESQHRAPSIGTDWRTRRPISLLKKERLPARIGFSFVAPTEIVSAADAAICDKNPTNSAIEMRGEPKHAPSLATRRHARSRSIRALR